MGKNLKGKELGTGISQRKDGYYVGRFTDRYGKRIQHTFLKLQECRQWLADAQYADEHSNLEIPTELTVDAWYEYWINIKEHTVRANTVRNYKERYKRNIQPIIGKKLLQDITPIHCQEIMTKMAENEYRTSTIYQARIALYNMLQYAVDNDILKKNPCNKVVKSNIGKESKKMEALTRQQQNLFLKTAEGSSYELQWRFILQTGLRTGELIGLKWSDIDFKNKVMSIERSMEFRHAFHEWRIGQPKSKSGIRNVPLTDEAIAILKLQKKKNMAIKVIPMEWVDYVFLCRNGTPVKNSTYDSAIYKRCEKCGLAPFGMHVLRHTFATRCIEGGMKPKTLQVILGHSNIGITMNLYVHVTNDEKIREIDSVSRALLAL